MGKDRLYCDPKTSRGRRSGLYTMLQLGRGIGAVLGPILPHLTEEMGMCCPVLGSVVRTGWYCREEWKRDRELGLVRELERHKLGGKAADCEVEVEVNEKWREVVEGLADWQREVSEVLGVIKVNVSYRSSEGRVV